MLNDYGNCILNSCIHATSKCVPLSGVGQNRRIPGWIESVQSYKNKALLWHNIWLEMGRPCEGYVAQIRRATRACYHRAIRSAVKQEKATIKHKIAESFLANKQRFLGRN